MQTTPAPPPAAARQPVLAPPEPVAVPQAARPRVETTLRRGGGMPGSQVLSAVSDSLKSQIWESEELQASDGDSDVSALQSDDGAAPALPRIGMPDDDSSDGDGDGEGDRHSGQPGERHAGKHGASTAPAGARAKAVDAIGPSDDCWDNPGDSAASVGQAGGVSPTAALPPIGAAQAIAAGSRERVEPVSAQQAAAGPRRTATQVLRIIGWGLAAAVVTVIIGVIASTLRTDEPPAEGGDPSHPADRRPH